MVHVAESATVSCLFLQIEGTGADQIGFALDSWQLDVFSCKKKCNPGYSMRFLMSACVLVLNTMMFTILIPAGNQLD